MTAPTYDEHRGTTRRAMARRFFGWGVRIYEIAAGWGCYVCAALPGVAGPAAAVSVVRPGQPACFGSDPDEQAFADNVCDACPHAHRCLDI